MLLFSFVFEWNLTEEQVLSIYKWENQTIYKNGKLTGKERLYYDMSLRVLQKDSYGASVRATFYTYLMPSGEKPYKELISSETADFKILRGGRFLVPYKKSIPNWRNVPIFPHRDLKVGDQWSGDAELIYLIFKPHLRFTYRVNYVFAGIRNGRAVVVGTYTGEKYIGLRREQPYPLKLISSGQVTILWNTAVNLPEAKYGKYVELFIFPDGSTVRYEGDYYQRYSISLPPGEVAKRFRDAVGENLTVEEAQEGVKLTVPNILFDFDSAEVKPEGVQLLKKLAAVLKKLPSFRLVIKGYTDASGPEEYNKKLSLKRAEAVSKILEKEGIPPSKISVLGEGEANPVAPNTPDKAYLNRRVEIYVLP